MIVHVERTLNSKEISYIVREKPEVVGRANYTFGITRQRLGVQNDSGEMLELRQTNLPLKLLSALPMVNLVAYTPFWFFVNGKRTGKAWHAPMQSASEIIYNGDACKLRLYNGEKYSLTMNGTQVALYQKEKAAYAEKYHFSILYQDNALSCELLLAICMLIDVTFYRNHGKFSLYKREAYMKFKDNDQQLTQRRPENEVAE